MECVDTPADASACDESGKVSVVTTPRWGNPDRPPLDTTALRDALTVPRGRYAKVEIVDRTDSTNAHLVRKLQTGGDWAAAVMTAPVLLGAEHQTNGKGRLGRRWIAPPGASLTASIGVSLRDTAGDKLDPSRWAWLTLLMSLGIVRVTRRICGIDAQIKWPNDVTVDGAKLAGILAEVDADSGVAVVGFGLNTHQTHDELNDIAGPMRSTPTSLRCAGAATYERLTMLKAIAREYEDLIATWRAHSGDVVGTDLAAYVRQSCVTVGQTVRVHCPTGGTLTGVAEGIDDAGQLLVQSGGEVHVVNAGDIEHLRSVS